MIPFDPLNNNIKCSVTAGVSPVLLCSRGFSGPPVRSGVGVYVITMTEAVPQNRIVVNATLNSSAAGCIAARWASPTTIEVRTFDNLAVATDASFFLTVERVEG